MAIAILPDWRAAALVCVLSLGTACNISERIAAGELQHELKSIPLDKSEVVRVNLRMGIGELNLDTGTPQLMEADFAYNTPSWKPEVDYRGGGSRGELTIAQRSGTSSIRNGEAHWNLKLN